MQRLAGLQRVVGSGAGHHGVDIRFGKAFCHQVEALLVAKNGSALTVAHSKQQLWRQAPAVDRYGHRAHRCDRYIGAEPFRIVAHSDTHAVARHDAMPGGQRVRQCPGLAEKVVEGKALTFKNDKFLIAVRGRCCIDILQ